MYLDNTSGLFFASNCLYVWSDSWQIFFPAYWKTYFASVADFYILYITINQWYTIIGAVLAVSQYSELQGRPGIFHWESVIKLPLLQDGKVWAYRGLYIFHCWTQFKYLIHSPQAEVVEKYLLPTKKKKKKQDHI